MEEQKLILRRKIAIGKMSVVWEAEFLVGLLLLMDTFDQGKSFMLSYGKGGEKLVGSRWCDPLRKRE